LADRDGRSPSAQLNHAADLLEQLLGSDGAPARVPRAVLLSHPRSRLAACTRPTVRVFTSATEVVTWLHTMPKALDRGGKRHLEDLITHGEHQQR
jgi:hypothetical protein